MTDRSGTTFSPDDVERERDKNLMRALGAGDQSALATLYERHGSRMLGLAIRILGVRSDAEDLVHDVFIEVLHSAKKYDAARGSVTSWLLLRVRSRAIDRLRTRKVAQDKAPALAAEHDARQDLSERSGLDVDCANARRAMDSLNDDQRSVIELAYFQGLTHREISSHYDIPLGTVKSRITSAILLLRQSLTEPSGANRRH